ncbi:MAG: protein kinase [Planctomycetota bacterium]|nr:protein kinase [Planctomycetota bacterium]
MAVYCPYCQFEMEVKGARPGRFKPKCPQCSKPFSMVVPETYGDPIEIAPLKQPEPNTGGAQGTKKEPVARPAPEPRRPDPKHQTPAPSGEATIPASQEIPSKSSQATMAQDRVLRSRPSAPGDATLPQRTINEKLGGYEIIKEIGRGAMGSVYLGRQISLDRPVAIKVMNEEWAKDPLFLSRFTREAYAAAQLVHHNVVQIYDIGEQDGKNFFSMEFVDGQSLGDLLQEKGRLPINEAVGYILQAARGLNFAHDKSMIHRDVKPDNLMLNRDGIVKVADLGLVKTPGSSSDDEQVGKTPPHDDGRLQTGVNITQANKAMGTPAFMAPEQVRDAASVDHRADIYSLGCTLYALVTGQTVFEGVTADEIMTKQATQPIPRPDAVVSDVPHELGDILMKMLAKNLAERYQNLDEVILVLQGFLGVQDEDAANPSDKHGVELAKAAEAFNASHKAFHRKVVMGSFFAFVTMLIVGMFAMGLIKMGLVMLGIGIVTPFVYVLLGGFLARSYMSLRIRTYLFGAPWEEWGKALLFTSLFWIFMYLLNLHWMILVVVIGALTLSFLMYMLLDRSVEASRREPLENARAQLRSMRLRGIEEDAIREFICRYCTLDWEPMYEALFGYEAKLVARQRWAMSEDGRLGKKRGVLRDRIVAWIESRERSHKLEKDKRYLATIERKALEAKGVPVLAARKQAAKAARDIIDKGVLTRAKTPGYVDVQIIDLKMSFTTLLLGSRARVALGIVLLLACVTWMHQNQLIPGKQVKDLGQQVIEGQELGSAEQYRNSFGATLSTKNKDIKPLDLPGLPLVVSKWFNTYNPGLAGLVLLISGFWGGLRMTFLLFPAVLVLLFAHAWGIPSIGKFSPETISLAGGGAIALLGLYFGRP